MATILSGGLESTDQSAIQKKHMSDAIVLLEPKNVPLSVLLTKIKKEKVQNPKFEWIEDERKPKWDKINNSAGYSNTDTSIVVANGDYFRTGELVKVPRTNETFRITNVSTNTLTVSRGTGAQALVHGDDLLILAGSNEEGSGLPTAKIVDKETKFNYTQIMKDTLEFTGTQVETDYYGGDSRAYQRAKLATEHAEQIERAFWFGERTIDTGGTHARRTTGGILQFLTTNVVDAGQTLTEFSFEEILETMFKFGSKEKYGFCSGRFISVINLWAKDKMRTLPTDKTYGLVISQYISPHGVLNLVNHPMLEGNVYGHYCAVLDMADKCVQYKYMQNRDTKLFKDKQAPSDDKVIDYFQSEVGLQFKQEKRHGLITNVHM